MLLLPAVRLFKCVVGIGDYHSGGINARKHQKPGFRMGEDDKSSSGIQVVGESVNDSLPVVESEKSFGICCTRVVGIGARAWMEFYVCVR
ncbi:hypothetical protein HanPI659440_Chr13g0504351 [Helianthus annuus]|nr:hypothetical protein HanPI659440_Chr13g0504351 [Helianthus annuus]